MAGPAAMPPERPDPGRRFGTSRRRKIVNSRALRYRAARLPDDPPAMDERYPSGPRGRAGALPASDSAGEAPAAADGVRSPCLRTPRNVNRLR